MSDYGNPSYWDERYAHEDKCYDWYVDYSQLKPYLDLYIPTEHDDTFEVRKICLVGDDIYIVARDIFEFLLHYLMY
jgi:hypothetical protein